MAPSFAFPSLPSLQSVRDLLPDTSPPVLYPETSRSRRSSSTVAATAAAAARQSFSCPSSPRRGGQRPLPSPDARLVIDQPCFSSYAITLPIPQMNGLAHPHIESPLDQTGPVSASSATFPATATTQRGVLAPHSEGGVVAPVSPLSLSPLPPRASAFDGTGAWRPIGTRTPRSVDPNATASSSPARSGHRRSQSVIATTSPVKPQRSRTLEYRNSIGSASALNLPTLAEDDGFARPVPPGSDRHLPHAASPLASPRSDRVSWLDPTPTPTPGRQTRSRAGSTVSVTLADVPPPAPLSSSPLPLLSRRSSITISTPIAGRSRRGSMASIASFSMNSATAGAAAPAAPAPATLVVSGISAVAEWSEPALPDFAPPSPNPRRNRSSIKSISMSSPHDQLRARLRSLSEIDTPGDGTPAAALAALTSRPSSTINASPHPPSTPKRGGTPARDSVTPTGAVGATPTASFPLSPTPTRRHRPSSMLGHNFRHSMPDPLILIPDAIERPAYRPTTSRLRQPAQLSMGEVTAGRDSFIQPRSRRPSTMTLHLEPASPPRRGSATALELPVSPIMMSSPGSLVSDNGTSSPTTSVESLTLGIPSLSLDTTRVADKWRRDIPDPSTSFRVFGEESIDSERFLDFDDI